MTCIPNKTQATWNYMGFWQILVNVHERIVLSWEWGYNGHLASSLLFFSFFKPTYNSSSVSN